VNPEQRIEGVPTLREPMPAAPASLSKRQVGQAARRRRILDAGAALFEAKGFEGATTDEIADAAQVTKRTLYRYVGSKEELLYEIHEDFMSALVDEVSGLDGAPEVRFAAMVTAHIADLAAHLPYIKVFFEEIKHLSATKRAQLVERREAYERMVNDILADGVAEDTFRDLDIRVTTRALLGAMNEGYRWYREAAGHGSEAIVRQATHLFLNGLAAPSSRASLQRPKGCSPTPRPALSDDPAERIIDAATKLFSAQGYHRTSTQEIADAAQVTKGALFYHVRYKEEALVKIHDDLLAEIDAALSAVVTEDRPALDVVADLVVAHVGVVVTHRESMAVVSEERKYLPPDAAANVAEREAAAHYRLEQVIRRGMAAGEIAAEDAHTATLMIVGMTNSLFRWYRPDARTSPDELAAGLADLVQRGIRNHERR
jgi:AcrR family transcriptional regulator